MNKLWALLLIVVAICRSDLAAYSQVYVTDVNTDRASLSAAPPNVLGLLSVGANYTRVLKTNILELGRISSRGWDVLLVNNITDSNQVPFLYRCIVIGRYSSSNTNNQPAGALFFNIADHLAGINNVRELATNGDIDEVRISNTIR